MNYIDKIIAYCKERNISETRLAQEAGLSKGLFPKWKHGVQHPRRSSLQKVAAYMGTTVEDLMREIPYAAGSAVEVSSMSQPDIVRDASVRYIPVLRDVSVSDTSDAGNITAYIPVLPDEAISADNCFAMKITDSSMMPELGPEDVVIVQKCEDPAHGDIVVVGSPGKPTVCRKLVREKEGIVLQPFNRHYDSVSYRYEEMDMLSVFFIGKVIGMRRDIRGTAIE